MTSATTDSDATASEPTVITGPLRKMLVSADEPIDYTLRVGTHTLAVNPLIGERISIEWLGSIHCIHCGRNTKKSFSQGYCWPCFRKLAETDQCVMAPEKCHYHEGTCRDPDWGERHCMQPHVVYLANTSGLKVGITRATQVPIRWIDQGAVTAVPIAEVATRQQAGLVEDVLRAHTSDRTHWQRMLNLSDPDDVSPVELHYPLQSPPTSVKALNLEKLGAAEGTLLGVKGQYLVLDSGVMNVRKFTGYDVRVSAPDG